MKAGDKEHFRYVSTRPGAQCAVTPFLTQVMLKYFVNSLKDLIPVVNRQLRTIDKCLMTNIITGATEMPASSIRSVSAPLFLSSLHCSEGDESLLADCSHDLLGLASCDETSGLAVARCFGK